MHKGNSFHMEDLCSAFRGTKEDQRNLLGKKKFSSTLLGSSSWSKNEVDMRQLNKRKQNLIPCIHERDPGELSNSPKWLKPSLSLTKDIFSLLHLATIMGMNCFLL